MSLIELDEEFLDLFYSITNTKRPQNIDLSELKSQLKNIVNTLKELSNGKNPTSAPKTNTEEENGDDANSPAILVVDDLGVITYQLKVLLSEFNMDVDCSQEIYDAVGKFKYKNYTYVVMDLFIPTEREGFILLTELKKMATAMNRPTVIGIITASPRKEIEQQCLSRGADFFLEKTSDWQAKLKNIMSEYINANKENENW